MIVFVLTVLAWATDQFHGVPATVVGLMTITLLMLPQIGALDWKQAQQMVPWNVFVLYVAGLSLGTALGSTGAAKYLAEVGLAPLRAFPLEVQAACLIWMFTALQVFFTGGGLLYRLHVQLCLPTGGQSHHRHSGAQWHRGNHSRLKVGLPVAAEAILLIEVDGASSAVEKHCSHLIRVCRKCSASEIQVAETDAQADKLWQARRAISPACGRINPTKISEDATVPRSQLPSMVRRLKEIAEKYRLQMVVFGHAGDGNLHPNILTNKHNQEEMARDDPAIEELFRATLELGGTLSGEHGIGFMKAPFLEWETGRGGVRAGPAGQGDR